MHGSERPGGEVVGSMKSTANSVCHLTTVHRALDDRIFLRECRTLAASGYDVTIVAPEDSGGCVDGVRVHAVDSPRGRLARMTRTLLNVYLAALKRNARTYHLHDPELIPIGFLLRLQGKNVVYDSHEDLVTDVLVKEWIPERLRPAAQLLCHALVQATGAGYSAIVAATPTIAERFPSKKTSVIRNYPVPDEIAGLGDFAYEHRPYNVIYLGGLTTIRGCREMVGAVGTAALPSGTRLVLAGTFQEPHLEAQLRGLPGWERVEFLGWQPRSRVSALLGSSRVGLCVLHPVPSYVDALPVKLFEYMAAGMPVIASDFPLWRAVVSKAGCGFLVDPRDTRAIGDAIAYLLNNPEEAAVMGRRGREAVLAEYNWAREAEALLGLYASLSHSRAPEATSAISSL